MAKQKGTPGAKRKTIPNPMTFCGRVAVNVIAQRKRRGWNVRYLAERLGVTPKVIYRIEGGESPRACGEWGQNLCELLEIDPADLMRRPRK